MALVVYARAFTAHDAAAQSTRGVQPSQNPVGLARMRIARARNLRRGLSGMPRSQNRPAPPAVYSQVKNKVIAGADFNLCRALPPHAERRLAADSNFSVISILR